MYKVFDFLISPENYDVILKWALIIPGVATAAALGVIWIPVILKHC
jgi:hypothetical protein